MPTDIDDRFVDVDFMHEGEYVYGAVETPAFSFSQYEDEVPLLTDSEIDEAIERIAEEDSGTDQLVTRIFNQKREGSCVANACAQAHQILQALQFGTEQVIQLSAISLYKRIGRSASSGATVRDGLVEMTSKGLLPLDTPENRVIFGSAVMPNTGFKERFPPDWKLTAKRFRGQEYHIVRSTRGILTALCNRHPVIVGREGHSICYTTPIRHKNRHAAKYANSWDYSWGMASGSMRGGFGIDTMRQVEKSANWAVVLRSVVDGGRQ